MSNQEAIALLRNLEDSLDSYCELSEEGKTAFCMAIEALSSSEIPNSSDAISRQDAIDALNDAVHEHNITDFDAVATILALPSITPKQRTGKWILDRSGAYCCSECMEPCAGYVMMKPRDKFCKMCGAKMTEGDAE